MILNDGFRVTLPTYQVRRVEFQGMHKLHVDDDVVDAIADAPVSLHIEPAAVELLEPGDNAGSTAM